MRLVELRLKRTPGIREAFCLEPAPGVNLVTGPNAIGKSSICRAVLALLWPEVVQPEPFAAEAEFALGDRPVTVSRQDNDPPVWRGARPDTGPDHLAGRYLLGVLDLLAPAPGNDPLAREIRRHMAGGFDLEVLRRDLFTSGTGRSENTTLARMTGVVTRLQTEQRNLASQQDLLIELRQTRELAGQARDRQAVLEMVRDLARHQAAAQDALQHLQGLPTAAAQVRPEDPEKLVRLRRLEYDLVDQIETRAAHLATLQAENNLLAGTGGDGADLPLDLLKKKLGGLNELAVDLRQAEREAHDQRLAEVLEAGPPLTPVWPYVVATVVGAILLAVSLWVALPGDAWPRVVFGLGIAAGAIGLWGWISRPRDAGRAALIRDKQQELARKQDLHESCRRQWDEALAAFNTTLDQAGIPAVSDVAEANHLLEKRDQTRTRLRELRTACAQEEASLKRDRKDLAERRAEISGMFARLDLPPGLDSDAEVARLLQLRPAFERTVRDRDDALREVTRLQQGIASGQSWLRAGESLDIPPAALEELISRERDLAGDLRSLDLDIARIEADIEKAQGGDDLQQALAERDAAFTALADVRQTNREAALGGLLLDRMARQHEMESRPRVLEKARELFSLFTGHGYELRMAAQGEGPDRFLAVPEDAAQPLELHELSDGTRAQLLLAVKLAFIAGEEQNARPPIFLDDSLSSADPERFAAVAASLGRLAEQDGRQIFYLTPNPADAAAFGRALAEAGLPPAHPIDLAEVRGRAGAADPALLDPANLPVGIMAPDPAGMTAARYAEALLVPRPIPWARPENLHVMHLMNDDLDLVRRLVDGNAANLNRFAKVKSTLLTAGQIEPTEAAVLEARGELWKAWLDGWRIGRARPVTRKFLKESQAVSDSFLEPVTAVLEEIDWDGARLLEAIETKRVKGFRAQKLELLRQELDDADLLDPRPPLTDDELITHTLDRVAPLLAANLLDMQKVRTLALTFTKLVEK